MEKLTCLAFNLTASNLLLMGFDCNKVLAYMLVMTSATPTLCLFSCLRDQMIVSPEFSLCFPAPEHLASAISMMARLQLFISRIDCACLPL